MMVTFVPMMTAILPPDAIALPTTLLAVITMHVLRVIFAAMEGV
jgi:hypothetical protein